MGLNYIYSTGLEVCERIRSHLWNEFLLIAKAGKPDPLPLKQFKPKFDLPLLEDYSKEPDKSFWEKFPKNYNKLGRSLIDHKRLKELVLKHKIKGADMVLHDLEYGASIGCRGESRLPSCSTNSKTCYSFGAQISDSVADWVKKGFAYGPIKKSALPKDAKVSGIMTKLKPNGSVRVILNLSAPIGNSVNDGINIEEFPVAMSSTEKWIKVLNKAGHGCKMVKLDWADAYKHISVCSEDINLQFFSWLGLFFAELCLIFGCSSSVGIYDRAAKVVLAIVLAVAFFPSDMVCQHLDDVVAAAPSNCDSIYKFDESYKVIADYIGVKLAPRDDPDKAFAPSTCGTILGVQYDTLKWTWSIPLEKMTRILELIYDILGRETVEGTMIESLAGKIIHIRALIPESRFHVSELMKCVREVRLGGKVIEVNDSLRMQLDYWRIMIPYCNGNMNIPNIDALFPQWAIDFYTDAAGGSGVSKWHGLGVVFKHGWCYLPWTRNINFGKRDRNGRILAKKLSFLEILGPLLVLCCAPDIVRGKNIKVWVDNIGAVEIWRKGYSRSCGLCTAVTKAIALVASHLHCRIDIVKIRRCSNDHALMADALSKGDMHKFLGLWGSPLPDARKVPGSLIKWLSNPQPGTLIGTDICNELDKMLLQL